MDSVIAGLPRASDGDLMICRDHGVAYQSDMTRSVPYDDAYFDKCAGYEGQEIARKINAGRVALVNRHAGPATPVVDIGIGSGEFIRSRPLTFGRDINETAIRWLQEHHLWAPNLSLFKAFTFWDVLEHVREPDDYFRHIAPGAYLFASLPIFDDLSLIRTSKHYRPDEHYYYFTTSGFVVWMASYRFGLLECSDFETRAGRESILSFAFRRT